MKRAPRLQSSRLQYHVTVYANPTSGRTLGEEDFSVYLGILKRIQRKHQFLLFNYELIPDCVHLFLKPSFQVSLSKTMQLLNWSFARNYNRRKNQKGHFWLERYRSVPVEKGDPSMERMRDINKSAFQAGLVQKPGEWKWSAYPALAEGAQNDLITFHPDYLALGITSDERRDQYRQWVNQREDT
jgi:putative transposase